RDAEARKAGEQAYQEDLDALQAAHPDLTDEDMELIHPFIAAADSDTEAAYAGYQQFVQQFKARHGITPAEAEEETPAPPPVLGGQAAAPPTPPGEKKYTSIDEAMDDFFAEKRATPPPVVGSV